jgi:hypothetical protein
MLPYGTPVLHLLISVSRVKETLLMFHTHTSSCNFVKEYHATDLPYLR